MSKDEEIKKVLILLDKKNNYKVNMAYKEIFYLKNGSLSYVCDFKDTLNFFNIDGSRI